MFVNLEVNWNLKILVKLKQSQIPAVAIISTSLRSACTVASYLSLRTSFSWEHLQIIPTTRSMYDLRLTPLPPDSCDASWELSPAALLIKLETKWWIKKGSILGLKGICDAIKQIGSDAKYVTFFHQMCCYFLKTSLKSVKQF